MIRAIFSGIIVAGALAVVAMPAAAQGLDGLHDQRAEGGRWCMSSHSHFGSGSGPTRQAAERDAAANYAGFTAWEYGDQWGSFAMAAGKAAKCSQSGGGWSCSVEARPCRSMTGGGAARRPRPRAKS